LSLDADRVTVVYRGRDPKRLGKNHPERRESARQTFGVDSDAEVFLAVGRQEFQKGYMFLIAAFAEVAVQRPDSVLMLAGREGNATEALKRDVTARGLADRIRFLGHRDDVTDLIVGADVFVFPSLWEGLGGALVEALGLEVPIVASDLPAIREVVVADVNGVLVPPADSRALGEALVRMIADPDERRRLVSANRSRFESLFSFDSCSDQLIRLIGDVAT
jgi:glycosyltransferase involved in cell wall biosynthesis